MRSLPFARNTVAVCRALSATTRSILPSRSRSPPAALLKWTPPSRRTEKRNKAGNGAQGRVPSRRAWTQNSAHGFFERLGWSSLDPVPFLVKPLRLNYALRRVPRLGRVFDRLPPVPLSFDGPPRLPAHRELRPIASFDAHAEVLWREFSAGVPIAVDRSSSYLNWRLVAKPGEAYRRVGLFENGTLIGFVAFVVKAKHGGSVGYVLELLHRPTDQVAGRALLQYALSEMKRSGAEVVLAWNLEHSPNHGVFREAGFFTLPERLRPIELHVGARPLAAPPRANLANRFN
jgi:hypothetical protein